MHLSFYLLVVFTVSPLLTLADLPHTKCPRTYNKMGCFKAKNRLPNKLLITDRDRHSSKWDGHSLVWTEWEESIHSLACRCAEATRKEGFTAFGLQNYGECWSGPEFENSNDPSNRPDRCWGWTILEKPIPPCNISDPRECMGKEGVNFIYTLQDVDECIQSPCKNGGTCTNTVGGFNCKCSQGFKGNICDQDVDECTMKPCKNGGTCTNSLGSFHCSCPHGFQGHLCDQDVNECKLKPCTNGGTCSNTHGSFHCSCPNGFKGNVCDQDVNECTLKPCTNGGTCTNSHGSFHCSCRPGFKGTFCDQDADECVQSPCKNGGTCINLVGDFDCKCSLGFKGKICDQDINECREQAPCKNGGTCINTPGSYHCQCASYYTGKHCQQDVDECMHSVCVNRATCVNTHGGFHCICPPGFKGTLCSQDVDECEHSPCQNGATCINFLGAFQCVCPAGFKGTICDQDQNECLTQPCQHDGTCVNTLGSYKCLCKHGFSGPHCENGASGCASKSDSFDLGLIIDGSGSVGNSLFRDIKVFLIALIRRFNIGLRGTRFGMIVFSDEPTLAWQFSDMKANRNQQTLMFKIFGLMFPDGGTRTDRALKMAGTELFTKAGGDRDAVPNVLLVMTDGPTDQGSEPYKNVLQPLENRGVQTIAVGIGDQTNKTELVKIAMGTEEHVIQVPTVQALNEAQIHEMIENMCFPVS